MLPSAVSARCASFSIPIQRNLRINLISSSAFRRADMSGDSCCSGDISMDIVPVCALLTIECYALLQRSLCKACLALHHTEDLSKVGARHPCLPRTSSSSPMTVLSFLRANSAATTTRLGDARVVLLLLLLGPDARNGRQLQHRRLLTFIEPRDWSRSKRLVRAAPVRRPAPLWMPHQVPN